MRIVWARDGVAVIPWLSYGRLAAHHRHREAPSRFRIGLGTENNVGAQEGTVSQVAALMEDKLGISD